MPSRTKSLHWFAMVCMLAAMIGRPAAAERSGLEDRLGRRLHQTVLRAAPSPDGAFVAVITERDLALMTRTGRIVWRRRRTSVSRWLAGLELSAAAGPGGKLFAVTGGAEYRYVLILDAHGKTLAYLKPRGTPRAVTFDHQGRRLAIGTAAGSLYSMALDDLAPRRAGPAEVPTESVREIRTDGVLEELAFSPDDRLVATTAAGVTVSVADPAGGVIWQRSGGWITLVPGKDWHWFVVTGVPGHGPQYGSVSLVSRAGKSAWTESLYDPEAVLSPDERFVLIRAGKLPEGQTSDFPYPPFEWMALDRAGHPLPRTEKANELRFVAVDGTVLTLLGYNWTARDRADRLLWRTRTQFTQREP